MTDTDQPSTSLTTTNAPPKRVVGRPFPPGVSGNPGGGFGRARQKLNHDTIKGMQLAFEKGGQKAIDHVMRTKPDIFLKLLVLLVPREMKVEHSGGVKAMTDEQLEQGIEAITAMLAAKAGDDAQVIEGTVVPPPAKPRRKPRKKVFRKRQLVPRVGARAPDVADS